MGNSWVERGNTKADEMELASAKTNNFRDSKYEFKILGKIATIRSARTAYEIHHITA